MTRPNTTHKGFFVPNAGVVAETVLSEPDQIDFNIGGNGRWGVVTGCEVTVSAGTTAEVTAGIAVVDGLVVYVTGGQTITLGNGTSQPRFDLVCVDSGGMLVQQVGAAAANPVFPDPPNSRTVLAAVLAPTGSASLGDYVIDKRNMLQPVVVGTGTGNTTLVQNRNAGVDQFRISADGKIMWNDADATLRRSAVATVEVGNNLTVLGNALVQGNATVVGNLSATGVVGGSNIIYNDGAFPLAALDGTFLVRLGIVYIRRNGAWEEVITASSGDLPGDIKQSMRTPGQMSGWLPMTGQTISEANYPQLFAVGGLATFISGGTAPNRTMILPNATDRVFIGGSTPGTLGGANVVTLVQANLPAHNHAVSLAGAGDHTHTPVDNVGAAGSHTHGTQYGGGIHRHGITDYGHAHEGADFGAGYSNYPFIAQMWGADRNLNMEPTGTQNSSACIALPRTAKASADVMVTDEMSGHQHVLDYAGNHTHAFSVNPAGAHNHAVTEATVGSGTPVSIRNAYMVVYTYIKV